MFVCAGDKDGYLVQLETCDKKDRKMWFMEVFCCCCWVYSLLVGVMVVHGHGSVWPCVRVVLGVSCYAVPSRGSVQVGLGGVLTQHDIDADQFRIMGTLLREVGELKT